ncbi:MAG: hypothetical protein H7326_04270 [Bdellovibrionaceae bacterium]|nr:hypothetical protein [Pseudobdellovibrionaceae bacterium]
MKQFSFEFLNNFRHSFGGSLLEGKRKSARTLSTKRPIHLILKTSHSRFFNPGNRALVAFIQAWASRFKIKVLRTSLNWTHIHMIILIPSRSAYNAFIRAVTAAIVQKICKAKGPSFKGIFDLRPFTRILSWGKDLKNVFEYHDLNDLEAFGYIVREKKSKARRKKNINN